MGIDPITFALAKNYTDRTIATYIIPIEELALRDADVLTENSVDSDGNDYVDIVLQREVGTEADRSLVDSNTSISLSAPAANFGDAVASDVMSGKTFTSAEGLRVVGSYLPREGLCDVVSGTTDSNVFDTGLPSVSGVIIFRDTLEVSGLACGIYTGTTGYCFYVLSSLYCGVLKGPYFGINGGTVTWKGQNSTSMAEGVTYQYIAWGQ